MTAEQQLEAMRLLRIVTAASMASTWPGKQEEWIGWQRSELDGVADLRRDAQNLLNELSGTIFKGHNLRRKENSHDRF